MPTYRILEVCRKDKRLVEKRAAWKTDIEISGQFIWCADGGDEKRTKCFTLLDEEHNSYVGFLGLTLSVEDLQSIVNAYVAVEFVYLHMSVRHRGLSRNFIKCVVDRVEGWLNSQAVVWCGRTVVLCSTSIQKSEDGARFILRLEERLRAAAASRQLSFSSCVDAEG